MPPPDSRSPLDRFARAALTLDILLSLGALGGGAALMLGPRGEILPLPLSALKGSPFDTYFVPGLILFSVLGLGPLLAARLVWLRHRLAPLATCVVGVALLVWLAVEIAIVGYSDNPPLQPFYLLLGVAITIVGLIWLAGQSSGRLDTRTSNGGDFTRWMYRGGRPNRLARLLNRVETALASSGIAGNRMVTLEVVGRKSGRVISLPLVPANVDGQRYLVSMLGEDVAWVRNVRAAGGRAVLRHGGRETVRLEDVSPAQRAPILKDYLSRAPGARPHIPVDKDAPLSEFAKIAASFPVFRVLAIAPGASSVTVT
jgi:deazaflavin-dependent oxidoreductase (nitroreductase family)